LSPFKDDSSIGHLEKLGDGGRVTYFSPQCLERSNANFQNSHSHIFTIHSFVCSPRNPFNPPNIVQHRGVFGFEAPHLMVGIEQSLVELTHQYQDHFVGQNEQILFAE
jgi:hypothetical protein